MAQITFTIGGQSQVEILNGARTTIGRAPDNVIVLDNGTVSAHHAEIANRSGSFLLRDLNSSNGTRVKGTKITEVTLADGEEVVLGSVVCVFADPTSKTPASPHSTKRKNQKAYRIVVIGAVIFLPIFLFVVKKRVSSPLTRQFHPATPGMRNSQQVAVKLDANASDPNRPPLSTGSTDARPHEGSGALQQAALSPQNVLTVKPKESDSNPAFTAPQLSTAVVATLGKEAVVPFVHKFDPSYNPADGKSLLDSLWDSSSGNVKTTIRNPKYDVYIVLRKGSASPSAVGMAFPINKSGWILIPPDCIARIITSDKPVSEKIQAGLNRFHGNLSVKLYAAGECTGLIQFENGNGMRIDIKEDPKFPDSLIFKTSFLPKGSYNVSDFDPELVVAWQDDANTKTTSHGKTRTDGWLTFETARYME